MNQSKVEANIGSRREARENKCERFFIGLDLLLIGLEFGGIFFNLSVIAVIQIQSICELLLTLKITAIIMLPSK